MTPETKEEKLILVGLEPGQRITIFVAPEVSGKRTGEVSYNSRKGLYSLATAFGREIYQSERGSDNEFGNIRAESEAALPVVASLRQDKVTLPQVRDVVLDISQGSIPGLSTQVDKRAWSNRFTINLKTFADQVLGEPDLSEYSQEAAQ